MKSITQLADGTLSYLLSRRSMYAVNRVMLMVALRGLGIGNWRSSRSERLFLRSLAGALPRDAVVLDIGANSGGFATLVKSALPGARLYAFEPHPATFARLKDCASSLGFEAVASACGAEPGVLTLYDYADANGSSHASAFRGVIEDHHKARSHGQSRAIEVPVTTIDDFLHERGIERVDLMKIDVEGSELSVLKGAMGAFEAGRIGMVQLEFSELDLHARTRFRDFEEFLRGFELYRMLGNGTLLPLTNQPALMQELYHYQNLVAKRAA